MHAGGRAAGWGGGAVLGLLHCWRACLQRGARWPANAYLPAGAGELRVAVQDRQQQVVVRQPLRLGLGEEGAGWHEARALRRRKRARACAHGERQKRPRAARAGSPLRWRLPPRGWKHVGGPLR